MMIRSLSYVWLQSNDCNSSPIYGIESCWIILEILQHINILLYFSRLTRVAFWQQTLIVEICQNTACNQERLQFMPLAMYPCMHSYVQVGLNLADARLEVHVYQLQDDGPAQEELDDEDLAAASHWLLPATDFKGLWESLIFDSAIKQQVVIKLNSCSLVTSYSVYTIVFPRW